MVGNECRMDRIITDPHIMTGKPIIRGTRLTVQFILGLIANGMSVDDILTEYGSLTREDIAACLTYASKALDDSTFLPLPFEA